MTKYATTDMELKLFTIKKLRYIYLFFKITDYFCHWKRKWLWMLSGKTISEMEKYLNWTLQLKYILNVSEENN